MQFHEVSSGGVGFVGRGPPPSRHLYFAAIPGNLTPHPWWRSATIGFAGYLPVIAMSAVMFLIESNRSWRIVSKAALRRQRRADRELDREIKKSELAGN